MCCEQGPKTKSEDLTRILVKDSELLSILCRILETNDNIFLYLITKLKFYTFLNILPKFFVQSPLPKQKYGNGMGLLGPYLTHRWEWYGKVTWVYGIGMGPNFTKFLTMGHAWEENRRLLILWETYGNKVPIHIPYQ